MEYRRVEGYRCHLPPWQVSNPPSPCAANRPFDFREEVWFHRGRKFPQSKKCASGSQRPINYPGVQGPRPLVLFRPFLQRNGPPAGQAPPRSRVLRRWSRPPSQPTFRAKELFDELSGKAPLGCGCTQRDQRLCAAGLFLCFLFQGKGSLLIVKDSLSLHARQLPGHGRAVSAEVLSQGGAAHGDGEGQAAGSLGLAS